MSYILPSLKTRTYLLDERAVDAIMNILFENYKTWVHIFWKKADLRLSQGQPNVQQRKILYMGLYLLIWGEMAYKLHGLLAGNVSVVTGENIKPSYGGDNEASLRKVITPLYHVDEKESKKGRKGKAPYSSWCNYDDLNEYFWSYSLEAVSFSSALGKEHLGDVVYVELPEVGASVAQGSSFGAVESVKATSDVNSPILGEVVEVNEDLGNSPDKNTLKSPPSEAKTDLYMQWLCSIYNGSAIYNGFISGPFLDGFLTNQNVFAFKYTPQVLS